MRRFLIVDDNVEFAENLSEIIGDAGHEAAVAANVEQAMKLAASSSFDAVVTDMRMPGGSGADLVRELRRVDPSVASIVISAYTSAEDIELARRYGLFGVLPKPVPLPRLMKLLETARRDSVVAVVDDDAALADNLSEVLQTAGFATVVAHSLAEAERIGATPFAAVVDLRFPGAPDGAALAEVRGRFPSLPVVVVTGHNDVTPPTDVHQVFFKPFDPHSLVETLTSLYGRRALTRG